MPARRIIFVNRFFHPDISATSRILSDVAFHIAALGLPVSVVTSRGRYDDEQSILPDFEVIDGVEVHRVVNPRFGRKTLLGRSADYLALYLSFAIAAWRLSARGDILIVKTDPPLLSVALAPIAAFKRLVMVNWLQDLYPEVALRLGLRALAPFASLLIAARNASLRLAANNVVIGESMHTRIKSYGIAKANIEVISNWCDDEALRPVLQDQNPLRIAWGLGDKFVVGYSGNLGRAHEFTTVLDAATLLRDERDIIFLFVGGGHLTTALKQEVARRRLADNFQFRSLAPAHLLSLSLGAPNVHWLSLPPSMEGLILPSKLYGVAAAARPIIAIANPRGEVGELIQRHDCGVAIEPGDSDHLARTVLAFRDDPLQTQQRGHNARHMLEENFRKRDAVRRWERLIERL